MLVVKAEFAVDVLFLIFECDGRSLLSYVVKIWNKKEPQRVIHTMAHQSKISYFSSDTGSFHSKGQNRQIASFFCTQKLIFEKTRKWAKKREKRRKTCVFQGASFLYALRGGGEGNRTPVRKSLHTAFSGCIRSFGSPPLRRRSAGCGAGQHFSAWQRQVRKGCSRSSLI